MALLEKTVAKLRGEYSDPDKFKKSSSPKVASPQTELQKGYRRVRCALEQLLAHVGLRAA